MRVSDSWQITEDSEPMLRNFPFILLWADVSFPDHQRFKGHKTEKLMSTLSPPNAAGVNILGIQNSYLD